MKLIVIFAVCVAVVAAAPQSSPPQQEVVVVKQNLHDNVGFDSYRFNYELSDGQTVEESAQLQQVDSDSDSNSKTVILNRSGSFAWIDPKTGIRYLTIWTADDKGYHPVGDHIPV